jgi:hypothetical protein
MHRCRYLATAVAVSATFVAACSRPEEPHRGPPPPSSSIAKPAVCADGGGKVDDKTTAAFFPRVVAGFCVDPNGGDKACGEGTSVPIDHICDLFDGECEIYKGYGVRHVVQVRYIDSAGTSAAVEVYLSKFGSTEGAFAMFTRRVVGDADPADESTPRALDAGGMAALGLGNAYVWRGPYLAELTYNNDAASEAVIKSTGEKLLPPIARELGTRLPGDTTPPASAAALPRENRLPLGVRLVTKDLLDIDGVGEGAFGYYRAGPKRYRLASLARADVDQAKDVLATFARQPGATKEKGIAEGAVRLVQKDGGGPAVEWIFARWGKRVLGIADEPRVIRPTMTPEDQAKVSLPRDEKVSLLKKTLAVP